MARRALPPGPNKGTLIAAVGSVCVAVGGFALEFLPNTVYLNTYKSVVQMYRLGQEVPVDKNIRKLFDQVLDDLEIKKPKERERYQPFTITGFNAQHAGLGFSKYGAIIGIPINYTFVDRFAIDTSELRLGRDQELLNIYHPAADDLLNSLVFSDKAKKFSIAREILMSQKEIPLYRSIETPIVVTGFTIITEMARLTFQLPYKPPILTVLLYGISGLMGYSVWFQIRDIMYTSFEKSVDKELAKLGPDYVEGGKEFYEKLLKKNVALRSLLGEQGKSEFNRDGDEIFFVRNKKTPITYRKKFFSELQLPESNQHVA